MRKRSLTIAEVMLQKLYTGLPTLILAAQQPHHAVDPPDANGNLCCCMRTPSARANPSTSSAAVGVPRPTPTQGLGGANKKGSGVNMHD